MGQYYKGVILTSSKKNYPNKEKVVGHIASWDFGCGAKLMEHSWRNNNFVNAFEELINKEHGKYAGYPVIWAGDYADEEPLSMNGEKYNIYGLCNDKNHLKVEKGKHYRYVINEDKKLFFDSERMRDYNGWFINPLPLLIADGNGRGGGDFCGKHERRVGCWKRNVVVVSDNKPDDTYKEIFIDWFEEW